MNRSRKPFFPIILVFVLLNGFFLACRNLLERNGFDQNVLLIGNCFLGALTIASYLMAQRGLASKNPHAFVRSIYGSIMMKLFLSLIVAFVYIATQRKTLNKPAFFTLMGLYLVYSFIEVAALTRQLRSHRSS